MPFYDIYDSILAGFACYRYFIRGKKIDTLDFIGNDWHFGRQQITDKSCSQVVFVFGESDLIQEKQVFEALRILYPNAKIVGASSSGSILGATITKSHIVATAVHLEKGRVELSTVDCSGESDIEAVLADLLKQLPTDGLRHVFVLADGLNLNGSALVKGLNKVTYGVTVTGGMAGDGDRFLHTWIISNAPARQNCVVAVGLYGEDLVISSRS